MSRGSLIAVVVVLAYVGFEAYAVHKVSYRMEPAYIHNMLIEARQAMRLCRDGGGELEDRFDSTLSRVSQQYREQIAEERPKLDSAGIERVVSARTRAASDAIDALQSAKGCTHQEMKNHFKRYEIYASRSR